METPTPTPMPIETVADAATALRAMALLYAGQVMLSAVEESADDKAKCQQALADLEQSAIQYVRQLDKEQLRKAAMVDFGKDSDGAKGLPS